MSAMHWEARRRQAMLDRRMSRDKQLQVQKESTEVSSKLVSEAPAQQPAVNECCHCQNKIRSPVQYSAKIDNRYSSTQYSQQW